jgi:hypothetical protein
VLLPLVGITQERILVALWWVGVTNLTAVMSARTPVPAGAAEPDIASPVAPERRSEILLPGGLHGLHALISTFLEAYLGEI